MVPTFVEIAEKKMVGKKLMTSMKENRIFELWSGFMPLQRLIKGRIDNNLYSIEIYPNNYFAKLDPEATFEKWACVEVSDFTEIPESLESMSVPMGKYAVFKYKGHPHKAAASFGYIFEEWLPASGYELDARPHMEVMGSNYKNDSDDSEEEFWIPVSVKNM